MGGLFKASKPSSAQVAQPSPAATATAAATAAAAAQAKVAEQQRRREAVLEQRKGRAGTVTTSDRGLLTPATWLPARKSLLGE